MTYGGPSYMDDIELFPKIDPMLPKKNRLPPGQYKTVKWPILAIDPTPSFNGKDWNVSITGLVKHPAVWTWEDFLKLPKSKKTADFHCVTGWSKFDNEWEGVLFKTICAIVEPLPEARAVTSYGNEFYTSSLPLHDYMLDEDVLLAYKHDGKDLEPEHGGPLRLVVPKIYAYKSTKWLKRLDFTKHWEKGFWELRGYANRAWPWYEERYSSQEEKYAKKNKVELQRALKKSQRKE